MLLSSSQEVIIIQESMKNVSKRVILGRVENALAAICTSRTTPTSDKAAHSVNHTPTCHSQPHSRRTYSRQGHTSA